MNYHWQLTLLICSLKNLRFKYHKFQIFNEFQKNLMTTINILNLVLTNFLVSIPVSIISQVIQLDSHKLLYWTLKLFNIHKPKSEIPKNPIISINLPYSAISAISPYSLRMITFSLILAIFRFYFSFSKSLAICFTYHIYIYNY